MELSGKIELGLIAVVIMFTALIARWLPTQITLGELALCASVLLLAQGLIRDVWNKYSSANRPAEVCAVGGETQGSCMCMESSLGIFGVLAGAIALLAGVDLNLQIQWYFWPILVLVVCLAGFALQSVVIDWKAKKLRLVKDHSKVRFGSRL